MLKARQALDGYRLIRPIGSGGFGEVWLCRIETTGEYRALKFIPFDRARHLDRELGALVQYRQQFANASRFGLITIEHVNRTDEGLFYVMPLADGPADLSPEDEGWKPLALDAAIEARRSGQWFSIEEIAGIFVPIAMALQALSDAGLIHRDIKPQNILFVRGEPQIADIGLAATDGVELSRLGTPGYLAPQWYLDSKGNPDMWGLAATLYYCATGNHPDYMSRPAYRWPPSGRESMSDVDQKRWLRLIGVAYRATQANANERFLQFRDFADALEQFLPRHSGEPSRNGKSFGSPARIALAAGILCLAAAAAMFHFHSPGAVRSKVGAAEQGLARSSPFDVQVNKAVVDFNSTLKEARSAILADAPPPRENDLKFQALLKTFDTLSTAPMSKIEAIFSELDGLTPELRQELTPIDRERLNDFVEKLFALASKPKSLASNAEEGFRGDREYAELLQKATDFQNQAEERMTATQMETEHLHATLLDAANQLCNARQSTAHSNDQVIAVQAECDEIYRLRDELDAKLPQL